MRGKNTSSELPKGFAWSSYIIYSLWGSISLWSSEITCKVNRYARKKVNFKAHLNNFREHFSSIFWILNSSQILLFEEEGDQPLDEDHPGCHIGDFCAVHALIVPCCSHVHWPWPDIWDVWGDKKEGGNKVESVTASQLWLNALNTSPSD